jgi:hypothetical protein
VTFVTIILVQSDLPIRICVGPNLIRAVEVFRENLAIRTTVIQGSLFPLMKA